MAREKESGAEAPSPQAPTAVSANVNQASEAPSSEPELHHSPSEDRAQSFYSARASKMMQIRDQQRALDQAPSSAGPTGLVPAARIPRGQATVPASIQGSDPSVDASLEPQREEMGLFRYFFMTIGCCASTGRRDGLR
eukprot:TRINITY_DN857_c8_g1_i2.p1 TRINITY_DN857_c8_g1~~TRINITY_DN857_c8_g1_i2.p1  ORF type:complete len:138 (-),score=26.64 TRINITY_DN857_c8_g1_i2:173-586(-)